MLFGVLPLYTAMIGALLLHDEPLRARLLLGVLIALGGLTLAFSESLDLGEEELAAAGALAVVASPLGASIGNISTKLREGGRLDAIVVNGWGMLAGRDGAIFPNPITPAPALACATLARCPGAPSTRCTRCS